MNGHPAESATGYVLSYIEDSVSPTIPAHAEGESSFSAHITNIEDDTGIIQYVLYLDKQIVASAKFEAVKNKAGKDGEDAIDYWLVASESTIKVDPNTNPATISPAQISINVYKQIGSKTPELVTEADNLYVSLGDDPTISETTTKVVTQPIQYNKDNMPEGYIYASGFTITLFSSNQSGAMKYDRETITAVVEGKNGTDGNPGVSITNVYTEYKLKPNGERPDSSETGETTPPAGEGHMWTREVVEYSDGNITKTPWTENNAYAIATGKSTTWYSKDEPDSTLVRVDDTWFRPEDKEQGQKAGLVHCTGFDGSGKAV